MTGTNTIYTQTYQFKQSITNSELMGSSAIAPTVSTHYKEIMTGG